MGKPASGTVVWDAEKKVWKGRITLGDGARPWIDAKEGLPHNERGKALAKEYISERAEIARKEKHIGADYGIVRRLPTSGKAPSEGVSDWYKRYYDWKEDRGDSSVRDARGRFKTHLEPMIGHLIMSGVTREKLEDVRDHLDREVRASRMTWKTALNVWNEITAAFRQATSSKNRALRVLERNPADGIAPPDKGDEREKPFLFPDEVVMLLSCRAIPLYRRVAYAVAIYTGVRSAELEALTSADCDVEHLQIMVARQADRDDRSKDKKTKTKIARPIEMEPALVPLLELLIAERPDGRLLHLPPPEDRPEKLREDLERAGCTREALKADDEMRAPMKFHNLRDTCLTHMVARKDDPWRVQARARHTSIAMTQKYIGEQGTRIGAAFGTPFPALPASLIEDVKELGSRHGSKAAPAPRIVSAIVQEAPAHKGKAPKSWRLGRNSHDRLGDPSGNRTRVTGVRGRCPNR